MKKSVNITLIIINIVIIAILLTASAFLFLFNKLENGVFGYSAFIVSVEDKDKKADDNSFFVVRNQSDIKVNDLIAFKDYTTTSEGILKIKVVVSVEDSLITAQNANDEYPVVVAAVDENYIGKVIFSNDTIANMIIKINNANQTFVYTCIFGMAAVLISILIILIMASPKKDIDLDDEYDLYFENNDDLQIEDIADNDQDIIIYEPVQHHSNQEKNTEDESEFANELYVNIETDSIEQELTKPKELEPDEIIGDITFVKHDKAEEKTVQNAISPKAQAIIDDILSSLN